MATGLSYTVYTLIWISITFIREQYGFRTRRSCDTQLISTIHNFATSLDNSKQVDTILLDLSKAFDKVPLIRLCHKLELEEILSSG